MRRIWKGREERTCRNKRRRGRRSWSWRRKWSQHNEKWSSEREKTKKASDDEMRD